MAFDRYAQQQTCFVWAQLRFIKPASVLIDFSGRQRGSNLLKQNLKEKPAMPRLQKLPISGKKSKNAAKFEKTKTAVVEAGVEVVTGEANGAEVRVGAVRGVRSGPGGVTVGAHPVLIAGENAVPADANLLLWRASNITVCDNYWWDYAPKFTLNFLLPRRRYRRRRSRSRSRSYGRRRSRSRSRGRRRSRSYSRGRRRSYSRSRSDSRRRQRRSRSISREGSESKSQRTSGQEPGATQAESAVEAPQVDKKDTETAPAASSSKPSSDNAAEEKAKKKKAKKEKKKKSKKSKKKKKDKKKDKKNVPDAKPASENPGALSSVISDDLREEGLRLRALASMGKEWRLIYSKCWSCV